MPSCFFFLQFPNTDDFTALCGGEIVIVLSGQWLHSHGQYLVAFFTCWLSICLQVALFMQKCNEIGHAMLCFFVLSLYAYGFFPLDTMYLRAFMWQLKSQLGKMSLHLSLLCQYKQTNLSSWSYCYQFGQSSFCSCLVLTLGCCKRKQLYSFILPLMIKI